MRYAKQMATYSDDGVTQNAAYGYRWRHAMVDPYNGGGQPETRDQLTSIVEALRKNPHCRRQVLQIWDHVRDLNRPELDSSEGPTKDAACNLTATFQVENDGRLDMVVLCRSNDAIWGCYGANAVHFSMLHEYVASFVGVPVGVYTQISVNWHAYVGVYDKMLEKRGALVDSVNPYEAGLVRAYPIVRSDAPQFALDRMTPYRQRWDLECRGFVTSDGCLPDAMRERFEEPFFRDVAWPIVQAHDVYKNEKLPFDERVKIARDVLSECAATDWRRACDEWLLRRLARWQRAADDGPLVYGENEQ